MARLIRSGAPALAMALAAALAACDRARPIAGEASAGGDLHGPAWMDVASPEFHAFYANRRLSSCAACHGPTLDGRGAPACGTCHDAALPAGVTSWKTNCTMCHGGADGTGAPPRATWGNSADPVRVGAHAAHVGGGLAAPLDCVACHAKPADVFSAGHLDGGTAVTGYTGADPVLGAALADPGWDRGTATCASAYCHGATLAGGTLTRPHWTTVDGTQAACGTCHGLPPASSPSPGHPTYFFAAPCIGCHPGTASWDDVSLANGIVAGGGVHVNARAEFTFVGHEPGWVGSYPSPRVGGAHAASSPLGCAGPGCGISMGGYYECTSCHGVGSDFHPSGGSSRVSCGACHPAFFNPDGTTSCTFCH